MVSFSCEQCCEVMKKPKLDAHAQRCWGAQFTCIDCNTTFEGTAYRAHTSCVSEEQRYHKSVYKAPKGKGKNQQQQQQQQQSKQQAAPAAPAPAVEPTQSFSTTTPAPAPASNKRVREDEPAATTASNEAEAGKRNGDVAPAVTNGDAAGGEPDKKKKKKDKKQKNKDKKEVEAAEESKPAASLSAFLTAVVEPLLQKKAPETSGDVSLAEVRRTVLDAAREKGYEAAEVEEKLWQGLKVGGKKGKVRVEF